MLDRSNFDEAVEVLVAELADTRLCVITQPERFAGRVLEVAEVYGKGVTNVMGHVADQVGRSTRFNPTRKQQILGALRARGVGMARPVLRSF